MGILRDDAIRMGIIKPTEEDAERMNLEKPKEKKSTSKKAKK